MDHLWERFGLETAEAVPRDQLLHLLTCQECRQWLLERLLDNGADEETQEDLYAAALRPIEGATLLETAGKRRRHAEGLLGELLSFPPKPVDRGSAAASGALRMSQGEKPREPSRSVEGLSLSTTGAGLHSQRRTVLAAEKAAFLATVRRLWGPLFQERAAALLARPVSESQCRTWLRRVHYASRWDEIFEERCRLRVVVIRSIPMLTRAALLGEHLGRPALLLRSPSRNLPEEVLHEELPWAVDLRFPALLVRGLRKEGWALVLGQDLRILLGLYEVSRPRRLRVNLYGT